MSITDHREPKVFESPWPSPLVQWFALALVLTAAAIEIHYFIQDRAHPGGATPWREPATAILVLAPFLLVVWGFMRRRIIVSDHAVVIESNLHVRSIPLGSISALKINVSSSFVVPVEKRALVLYLGSGELVRLTTPGEPDDVYIEISSRLRAPPVDSWQGRRLPL